MASRRRSVVFFFVDLDLDLDLNLNLDRYPEP